MLLYVVLCCLMLSYVALSYSMFPYPLISHVCLMLLNVALCCLVLPYPALCCLMFRYVASSCLTLLSLVYCSLLKFSHSGIRQNWKRTRNYLTKFPTALKRLGVLYFFLVSASDDIQNTYLPNFAVPLQNLLKVGIVDSLRAAACAEMLSHVCTLRAN